MRQLIRLFPDIWKDDAGAIEISVYRDEGAAELAQWFADKGIKTELVTENQTVTVMQAAK